LRDYVLLSRFDHLSNNVLAFGFQPGEMAGSQARVRDSFRVFGERRYYSTTASYRAPLLLSI
jgi:hypothetical protein